MIMTEIDERQLSNIRASSRRLVRELGFLNSTLADTRYSASAVHAIIEIGAKSHRKADNTIQEQCALA